MRHLLVRSIKKCGSFLKYVLYLLNPWLTSSAGKSFPLQCLQTANCQLIFIEELVKLFCSNYGQNPTVTGAAPYFHYNSYHHYHFYYHCKMHLYRLKILLTILLCNMIPCMFRLNFVFILPASLFPSFSFFTPSKRTQNWLTTIRHILGALFILIFISIVIYTEVVVCRYSSK